MIKQLFRNLFVPFHAKEKKILLFPSIKKEEASHVETASLRVYIKELLIMKGYYPECDIEFDHFYFDLLLQEQHYLLYCSLGEREDVLEKIYQKQLKRVAHAHGYRLYIIYKSHFYKDLNGFLLRLRLNFH